MQAQICEQENSLVLQNQLAELQELKDDLERSLADKKVALAVAVSALDDERKQCTLLQQEKSTLSIKFAEATVSFKNLQDNHASKTISIDMFEQLSEKTGQFGADALKEVALGGQGNVKEALSLLTEKSKREAELEQMKLRLADSERSKKETMQLEHVKIMMSMLQKNVT